MRLRFKQRAFSWLDSYDVYDESGATVYTVKGQLNWGHLLKIYDAEGREVGSVKERIWTVTPKFDLYIGDACVSTLCRRFSFFTPKYYFDGGPGWQMSGNFAEWDYTVTDGSGAVRAEISKELWNWTDTYTLEIPRSEDSLFALMAVIAVDAEKCSRN